MNGFLPLIAAKGVTKSYAGNVALRPTDFLVEQGDCVGIIGENGAGKSTLAKMLTGATRPDAGSLEILGREVAFRTPRDALAEGIALIPQELAFVPALTAAENIMLNRLPRRGGLVTRRGIRAEAQSVMARFGLHVDLDMPMSQMKLADQQVVEILKAIARESRVIVLDEPTAALSQSESARLFEALSELRARGLGIIVISHHLHEIHHHASRIDVFRNGGKVFSSTPSEATTAEFIEHMLGDYELQAPEADATWAPGPPKLTVRHWTLDRAPVLTDVSIELRAGEVVGVFGIRGCGSEALVEGLAGRRRDIAGTLTLGDGPERAIFRSPRQARAAGVAYVPPDRKREGLALGMSIERSIGVTILRDLAPMGFVHRSRERAIAKDWSERLAIKAESSRQPVGQLSGGNQQKVLMASRMAFEPDAIVVHEPSRGVDIGARRHIHQELRRRARAGAAVLVATSDVDEAIEVTDRLLVMRAGRVVAALAGEEKTRTAAVQLAGAWEDHGD